MLKPWCCAAVLLWIPAAAPTVAQAQGVTPFDTYRDAYGAPNYSGNLTPAPDDRTLLGPTVGLGDPFLTRTRPARTWQEIDPLRQGYWEFRADRLRRLHQDADETDARMRERDAMLRDRR